MTATVLGATALVADVADEIVVGTVRDMHTAIARRAFDAANRLTGGSARLPARIHAGIAALVYAGVAGGVRAGASACRLADRVGLAPAELEGVPGGRFMTSAVNGLIGDRLAADGSEVAIEMSVRHHGRDLPLDRDGLAAAFPEATGDVAVFVHGLCENEGSWHRDAAASGGSYGDRLARETSWTPVLLRVNTGLPIAENGVALAALMDRLVAGWPTQVRRIAFIGHSMGGLVVRAACAVVTDAARAWTGLVTDVATLGTPHLGAPLERAVALGSRGLGVLPESAPLGRILEHRSRGILDLRHGLASDVQNLPHARYHLVAATLAGSPRHPVSAVLGDLLVRYPSATGRGRRGEAGGQDREMFPGADVLHIRGGHFDLLNHPEVYAALRTWLSADPS